MADIQPCRDTCAMATVVNETDRRQRDEEQKQIAFSFFAVAGDKTHVMHEQQPAIRAALPRDWPYWGVQRAV